MRVVLASGSAHKDLYKEKLKSFAKGISICGEQVFWHDFPKPSRYDAAVIYGSYKTYRGSGHHKVKTEIANTFPKFIQLETPIIGRIASTSDHGYLRVGVNGFLFDEAKWGFEYTDKNRYKKVFEHTGYNPNQEWIKDGDHILILMQNPGDASLRGQNIFEWALNTVRTLKKHTDRKIIVRPHPLPRKGFDDFVKKVKRFKNVQLVENELPNNLRPLEKDFKNCFCAVSYSSGSTVDAVLAGVPVLATDPGNMAWDVSTHELNKIESRYLGDRLEWMQKISMCQWSMEEFENGECWNHIKKSL